MNNINISHANGTVVYVDDEIANTYLFLDQLEDRFNLKVFNSPQEALNYIQLSDEVMLVVTDQQMPDIDGLALAEAVKKNKAYLSFIMLTANPKNDRDLMYKSLKNNLFFDFLQKPLDFEDKDNLVKIFVEGIGASFENFLTHDFDRASKVFCQNPINLGERVLIKKIVDRYFDSKVVLNFNLTGLDLFPSDAKDLSFERHIFIEKHVSGEWSLFEVEDSKKIRKASSKKIENIFNLITNDPDLKGMKDYFKK